MPLKLVPSSACEGASFLALSDHEVTATPHAGTTFTYFRHSLDRCHQEPSVPRRDWLRRGARHAKRLPHKPRTKLKLSSMNAREAGGRWPARNRTID
eukprot:scaffold18381_cov79-Phaeocystis_antarctica.AAC.2